VIQSRHIATRPRPSLVSMCLLLGSVTLACEPFEGNQPPPVRTALFTAQQCTPPKPILPAPVGCIGRHHEDLTVEIAVTETGTVEESRAIGIADFALAPPTTSPEIRNRRWPVTAQRCRRTTVVIIGQM
jgi:hypothetical protein